MQFFCLKEIFDIFQNIKILLGVDYDGNRLRNRKSSNVRVMMNLLHQYNDLFQDLSVSQLNKIFRSFLAECLKGRISKEWEKKITYPLDLKLKDSDKGHVLH